MCFASIVVGHPRSGIILFSAYSPGGSQPGDRYLSFVHAVAHDDFGVDVPLGYLQRVCRTDDDAHVGLFCPRPDVIDDVAHGPVVPYDVDVSVVRGHPEVFVDEFWVGYDGVDVVISAHAHVPRVVVD